MKTCPNCGSEKTFKAKGSKGLFNKSKDRKATGWSRKCKDCGAVFDNRNNISMPSSDRVCPKCGGKKLKYNIKRELVCRDCGYNYEPEAMKEPLQTLRDLAFVASGNKASNVNIEENINKWEEYNNRLKEWKESGEVGAPPTPNF